MEKHKPTKAESVIIAIIAVLIFTIVKFSDQLVEKNLLIPLVLIVFIGGFGFFGFQSLKLWKQSDEEILGIHPGNPATAPPHAVPSFHDRLRFFVSAIAFVGFILFKDLGKNITKASLVFSGIVLTIACVYFLPALIQKLRGKEDQPLFVNTKLRPEHFIWIPFGLLGVGFCCFFCFIVITKLPLQIAIPCLFPPLIIGSAFARPLVAVLRILFQGKETDSGEKYVSRRKNIDPWDRPDREL